MAEYKQKRITDVGEKPRYVILNGRGIVIDKNPDKKRLDGALPWNFKYNDTNTCYRCGRNFDDIGWCHPMKERDEKGKWIGEWDCGKCWQKFDPNSEDNIKKRLRNRRTGNLKDARLIFGDNCEELTRRWRSTVSTVPVKNLNIENDNYNSPIDHSWDSELGVIQTKGRSYDNINGVWHQNWENEHNKKFDNLIFYCASRDGKIIERIYIFPWEEVIKRTGISIYKNPSKGIHWYEKYRVKDGDIIVKVNNIMKEIR